MREYLTSIGSRHKWFLPTENIKVGNVVLVIESRRTKKTLEARTNRSSVSRSRWISHSSRVRTGGVVRRRPISRLSPLEAEVTQVS